MDTPFVQIRLHGVAPSAIMTREPSRVNVRDAGFGVHSVQSERIAAATACRAVAAALAPHTPA